MSNSQPIESPYLTADEAANYLRFSSRHYFLICVKRDGIPCLQRGRRKFFMKRELDQFMAVARDATNPTRPSKRTRGRKRAA